ncbi:hypothetical protein HMPREF1548_04923 [Clostridium sp. KLE 1755]|nr:hypothetical protein HMPREF1548_04923 [Clostridium sp. KLE 1755]
MHCFFLLFVCSDLWRVRPAFCTAVMLYFAAAQQKARLTVLPDGRISFAT